VTTTSYSQADLIKAEVSIHEFIVDTNFYSQINFSYSNLMDKTFVLWFEREAFGGLSTKETIKKSQQRRW